jgi:hypothetical protein
MDSRARHPARPCRYVDVRVIDSSSQAVLAQGATDATGSFSLEVVDAQVRDVAILALTQSTNVTNLNYTVSDWNTGAMYAYQGILVRNHDPNASIEMGPVTARYRAGGEPFNLYDASFDANDCVGSMEGGVRPTAYGIRFTLDSHNDQAYYTPSTGVISVGGNYGYDDTILLHETGHAICARYGGWSDSPAGAHYFEDNAQDPRLSWGEGWPTFFGSSIRDWAGDNRPDVYLNSTGDSTTGVIGYSYSLETLPSGVGSGAASEVAAQACLWDITDGETTRDATPGIDDEPGYQMNRPFAELWSFIRANLSQPPFNGDLTYEDFHDLWIARAANPQAAELGSIEDLNHGIQYRVDAFETDDSFANPGSRHTFEDIGMLRKKHHTTWPEGDEDWVAFQGLAGITYQVNTATMRDGADTFVEIQDAAQAVLALNDNAGTPVAGQFNAFEQLRSTASYTSPTTQDLFVRVRRSPNSPWGTISKYGNWDLAIRTTAVPVTYPNLVTIPPSVVADTLSQNAQGSVELVISNSGTVDSLSYSLVESGGPIAWASEDPAGGVVPPGQSRTAVVSFDATGLVIGVHADSLEVHTNDPDRPIKYLRLSLAVAQPAGVEGVPTSPAAWLGESSPNPASAQHAIRFSLGRAGHARLAIYDVQGREVACLLDGIRRAGEQTAAWDGRDRNRQPVPSGVYFYRLEAEGRSLFRKLAVTK